MLEITLNRLHCKFVYQFKSRLAAHTLGYERQIFGRYAQFLGVFLHGVSLAIVLVEHFHEFAEQQIGLLHAAAIVAVFHVWRNDSAQLESCTLEDAVHYLLVEITVGMFYLMGDDSIILANESLTLKVEMHYRILGNISQEVKCVAGHLHGILHGLIGETNDFALEIG